MALAVDDFTRFLVARDPADRSRVFAQLAFRFPVFILKVEVTAALSIIPAAGNALTKTRANARGALRRASRGALVALRPNPGGVGESADGTFVAYLRASFGLVLATGTFEAFRVAQSWRILSDGAAL